MKPFKKCESAFFFFVLLLLRCALSESFLAVVHREFASGALGCVSSACVCVSQPCVSTINTAWIVTCLFVWDVAFFLKEGFYFEAAFAPSK